MFLDPYLLSGAVWSLRGPRGEIEPWLRLEPDGTVTGGAAGRFWEARDGAVRLLAQDRSVAMAFDAVGMAGPGRLRLAGATVAAPEPRVLVQLPADEFPLAQPRNTTAVLIRTHMVNSKLFALWSALAHARNFDVFVNIDETRGRSWLEGPQVLRHTVEDCVAMGLWPERRPDYLWFFGDYPIYTAMRQLPGYDTFVQVEYDVHVTGESPVFLEALIDRLAALRDRRIAAVGIFVSDAAAGWPWADAARETFGFSRAAFFPFLVVTRPAAEFLQQLRRTEAARGKPPVHCEAFVPTALQAGGLEMVDVNRLVANAVRPQSFNLAPSPLGLSFGMDGQGAVQMQHPVCDQEEFAARSVRYAAHERRPDYLLRWAGHEQLRPEFRARLADEARRIANEAG